MRTLELHASVKPTKRAAGRSSVAAAAYRSGSRLEDERTGLTHDYTKKQGVEHSRIYIPNSAPDWANDRAKLWNAVEAREKHVKATTAFELEVGFPAEFNAMQRREAGDKICHELIRRYGCVVDISFHEPSSNGDQRNYHAHILFTTRGFDGNTKDGWSKNKYRDLAHDTKDAQGKPYLDDEGKKTTRGKLEILSLRKFTADELNRIATRDRLSVKTEHTSFAARGIDREATQHRGNAATDMERNGKRSRIEDINRQRQIKNTQRAMELVRSALESVSTMSIPSDFEQAAKRKITENASSAATAKRDMIARHSQERKKLEQAIHSGKTRNTIQTEISSINERLNATGLRKVVRTVFRANATDKKNLINLEAGLERLERRENGSRFDLEMKHKQEREQLQQKQKERQEQDRKPRHAGQRQGSKTQGDSQSPQRRKTDKPFPQPPPPREAIRVAQDWGASSGQNAERVSESVQSRKIDTSRMAMTRDEKPKEFERRRGAEYDNRTFERRPPQEVKPGKAAQPTQKKETLAEARARAKQQRSNDNPEPKLTPKGLGKGKGFEI